MEEEIQGFEINSKGKSIAYFSKEDNPHVSREMIEKLKKISEKKEKINLRFCLNKNPEEKLQDMIILAYRNKLCKKPHKHMNSDEAVHMIQGEMLALTFEDNGKLKKKVVLNEKENFIFRNTKAIHHVFIPITEFVIYREVIGGEFQPAIPLEQDHVKILKSVLGENLECKNENCKNKCEFYN